MKSLFYNAGADIQSSTDNPEHANYLFFTIYLKINISQVFDFL